MSKKTYAYRFQPNGSPNHRLLGKWPGLDFSHLYENRDLAVTTDFRGRLRRDPRQANEDHEARASLPGYDLVEEKRLGIIA